MKKIILLTLCTLLLSGCAEKTTENDLYNEALSGCTMSGYNVYTHPSFYYGTYACMTAE